MAEQAGRIIGVEVVAPAIEDARRNAARNGVQNARFVCADAADAEADDDADALAEDAGWLPHPHNAQTVSVAASAATTIAVIRFMGSPLPFDDAQSISSCRRDHGLRAGCSGLPTALCNDANACALAEYRFGAGRGTRNLEFLTAIGCATTASRPFAVAKLVSKTIKSGKSLDYLSKKVRHINLECNLYFLLSYLFRHNGSIRNKQKLHLIPMKNPQNCVLHFLLFL